MLGERGGVLSAAGPPQGANTPTGGSAPRAAGERGGIYFVPGFPVMAWPMVEWVLDNLYPHLHRKSAYVEKSVIVFGAMEAALTPLRCAWRPILQASRCSACPVWTTRSMGGISSWV